MAEFQEVMLQAKRLCVFHDCDSCPLVCDDLSTCRFEGESPLHFKDDELANIEHIIMEWAKKNPPPRYPTYEEYAKEKFPAINFSFLLTRCVCELFGSSARAVGCDGHVHVGITCDKCWAREMPAKIAKELGAEKRQCIKGA